jgi:hypothetical protein
MQTFVNRLGWVLAAVVSLLVIAAVAGIVRAGPLDPPSAPAPTQPQVEPRSPIPPVGWNGTFPITISQPGSYFVTQNLSPATTNGIVINSDDVTLDLNGFDITAGVANNGSGIADGGTVRTGVVIRNGQVRGFGTGVSVTNLSRSRLEDLEVTGASGDGIVVGSGGIVRDVMAHDNVAAGIRVIQQASDWGTLITDSNVSRNGFGYGYEIGGIYIQANNVWVRNSVIDSNAQAGVAVTIGWSYNEITDNRITGNYQSGVLFSGIGTTNYNMVARNVLVGNGTAVNDHGTNSRIGTFVGSDASITGTNPWSNVVY